MGVDVENVWARLTELPRMPPRMGLFTSLSEWLNQGSTRGRRCTTWPPPGSR